MSRRFLLLATFVAVLAASAQEATRHGVVFEKWVRDNFFDGYRPASHTQRWDIPATANQKHGGIPVTTTTVKYGAAVDLGDALQQYEIDEPFMLVVGFWQQAEDGEPRFVNIAAPVIPPELWRKLWGPVTYADLLRLDALVKDQGPSVEELRKRALKVKNAPPFSEAVIQVNPRIDTHGQRRVLCSIRFADFFKHLVPGADDKPQEHPALFGVEYPNPNASRQREGK